PEDDTGVAHILEHSVFCGSRNYPLKDVFLVLAQGSLQTFLNAWTFPDKTVYPASSINEHDYFNLMAVYGDAVFRPLLTEWTFLQEGHRLSFEQDADAENGSGNVSDVKKLSITGVVYNEMKGAYSSLDAYAQLWSVKAAMPGTVYAFESGGDPLQIPGLTWENLKDFHKRRYSPANCKIFLSGNIDTARQLSFLNDKFFAHLDAGKPAAACAKTGRWDSPRNLRIPCPAGAESKATAFLSWLCSGIEQVSENLALAALTEILLGHDGSPLTRALVESGIGEDISPVSGLEAEIRELLFVAGLRGISGDVNEAGKKTEDLIMGELSRLVKEGIPREEIDAALLAMEFSQKEIRRPGGPFALVWMRLCLRGWLHGCKPWETLLFTPSMDTLKKNLKADSRYFESLIQKYFLDNPHRALVVLEPTKEYLPMQQAEFEKELAERESALSDDQRKELIQKAETLEEIQNAEDSPESLACIPHLSLSDLSDRPESIPRRILDLSGIPCLGHDVYTNGITYIDLAFPLDVLQPDDYQWLPFFSRAMVCSGLPGMDYGEVSGLLARTTGGFNALLHNGSVAPGAGAHVSTASGSFDIRGRDWIIYRVKCLDEKTDPSLDLILRILTSADFTDESHIRDLVLEMKSELDSSLAPLGHKYATLFSSRFSSRAKMIDEIWSGLSQIEFCRRFSGFDIPYIISILQKLREATLSGGLIVNITGSKEAVDTASALVSGKFASFGSPRPRPDAAAADFPINPVFPVNANGVVFSSPSLQIGYSAASFQSAPFDTDAQAAETVAAHQLSTGALWEEIRMKGGAYGAHAFSDSLENYFAIATYRDPNPVRSVESFQQILKNLAQKQMRPGNIAQQEDMLTKMIIGVYGSEVHPRTGAEKGLIDFFRFLYGITDDYRERKLKRIISVSSNSVGEALLALGSQKPVCPVIITGPKAAKQAAAVMGVEPYVLPV
ncbi:MAG: insulinase family protein, partial [Treponema sp.]|nr:insulinase family protein [Treponema sp.]